MTYLEDGRPDPVARLGEAGEEGDQVLIDPRAAGTGFVSMYDYEIEVVSMYPRAAGPGAYGRERYCNTVHLGRRAGGAG